MTNSRQNIVDVPQEAPAGLQRALSYYEQTLQLREQFPGVIIVPGIEALGDYLRHHTWSQSDVLNAYPWKVKLFRRTAGQDLPFILNTEQVRKAYPERFEFLDKEHKNAVKLFDPKDLKDWFRANLVSSIETVLVPLTMFTDHPDAMRDVYNGIKAERLRISYESKSRKTLRANRLSLWPEIVSHVRSDLRSQIGQFIDDAKARAAEQGIAANRAHFKEFEVKLPADKMPVFFEKQNIGKTRDYDSEEIRELFTDAGSELEKLILGENESLDNVRYDLNLITEIPGTGIQVAWETDNYDVIDIQGNLGNDRLSDSGTQVRLTARLSYEENQALHEFYVCVFRISIDDAFKISCL